MKITRNKTVKSSTQAQNQKNIEEVTSSTNTSGIDAAPAVEPVLGEDTGENYYCEAIEYIKSAISALSNCDQDDYIARDSIANLGVIEFDLASADPCCKENDASEENPDATVENDLGI